MSSQFTLETAESVYYVRGRPLNHTFFFYLRKKKIGLGGWVERNRNGKKIRTP